jgi:hypothetical protein
VKLVIAVPTVSDCAVVTAVAEGPAAALYVKENELSVPPAGGGPDPQLIFTCAGPATPGGVVKTIAVEVCEVIVAVVPTPIPNDILVTKFRLVPVKVTLSPPDADPLIGLIDVNVEV